MIPVLGFLSALWPSGCLLARFAPTSLGVLRLFVLLAGLVALLAVCLVPCFGVDLVKGLTLNGEARQKKGPHISVGSPCALSVPGLRNPCA